jgi:hypothetical protein
MSHGVYSPSSFEVLAEILAIQFDEGALPTFNTEETIMSVCSSLVTIVDRGGHQIVQFSHFSVKEYLTSERLAAAEEPHGAPDRCSFTGRQ